jgi:hypothetical protein
MQTRQFWLGIIAAVTVSGCASGGTSVAPVTSAGTTRDVRDATGALVDGGFESGVHTAWPQCGSGASADFTKTLVHSGLESMKMGGTTTEPNGDAAVCQSFTVPAGGSISFWVNESTNETSTATAYQYAQILNPAGTVLLTIYKEAANGNAWIQRTANLAAFAGQTVQIKFGTHGTAKAGFHIVQFVDDVAVASGGPTLTVLAQSDFISAINAATKSVSFSTYELTSTNAVATALIAAATRGVAVHVDFPSDAFAVQIGVTAADMATANKITAAGGTVAFDAGTQTPNNEPLHAKLAIIDGVGYLDGRNWDAGDVILKDTNANDLSVLTSALALTPIDGTQLDTIKQDALSMEVSFIGAHTGTIDFMTESFGAGSVATALLTAVQAGKTVHIIVLKSDLSTTEDTVLTQLQTAGADVRTNSGSGSEKMTIANGVAWFGSSNATTGNPFQIDWGMNITDPTIVNSLQSLYNTTLAASAVYVAP